jgi:YrbI family 3-deoxy-D-manno-octulosonate 8-phosphate phosphatase
MKKNELNKNIIKKAKKIKLLILDVDGVMTDCNIYYDVKGNRSKIFNIKDGLAIKMLKDKNIEIVILTDKIDSIIKKRAKDLGIKNIFLGRPKINTYKIIKKKYCLTDDKICYIGDDVNDIEIAKNVGLSIAVNDAVNELKEIAYYTAPQKGGYGAIRHIIEIILKAQKIWDY